MKSLLQSPVVRALAALALILLIGAVFNAEGAMFRWTTHRDMLRQASVVGILACGMTIVILSGGIDLAVGSLVGFTAIAVSMLTMFKGMPTWLAVPLGLAFGAAMGAASGGLIARFGVQPFIATLAMMVFGRGAAKWVSGGEKVSPYSDKAKLQEIPAFFEMLDSRLFGGNLAVVTLVFLGCVALTWFFLERMSAGRYVKAIGGNEEAARFSGVPVGRIKALAYAMSGFFAAVAGICHAAQEGQGDPEAGATYELSAIAMVVIGGTSLSGGRGSVALTLIGALTIGYLEKILSLNAVSEAGRLMLTGLIIVGAVLLQKRGGIK